LKKTLTFCFSRSTEWLTWPTFTYIAFTTFFPMLTFIIKHTKNATESCATVHVTKSRDPVQIRSGTFLGVVLFIVAVFIIMISIPYDMGQAKFGRPIPNSLSKIEA
jgi:hypothetical protein